MSNNLSEKLAEKLAQNNKEISQIPEAEIIENNSPSLPKTEFIQKVMTVEQSPEDTELNRRRHEKSLKQYPDVNVDDDEYVILSISRHNIGLLGIIIVSMTLFIFLTSAWILLCFMPNRLELAANVKNQLSIILGAVDFLIVISAYIGYTTYKANHFTVTNERVIQWIVTGLFNRKKQIINLESTEDISYSQVGIFQHMFNYGTIRLSTTGDESTYTFIMAKNPAKMVEIIGEIAECARENQPIPEAIVEQANKMSR